MAPQIVIFNTGRPFLLRELLLGGSGLDGNVSLRLFANDLTLSPSGPSTPFVQLAMPGYAPIVLSGAVDEGIDANGNDTWIWPVQTIALAQGSESAYVAYGYWVTANSDGTPLWGQLFEYPATWTTSGDYATLAPQLSLGGVCFSGNPITAPVVLSVTPSSGPAAHQSLVTLLGAYFTGATAVLFGGAPASSFNVVNDNIINALSPALPAATVDVQVRTNAGLSAAWNYATFTYTP